jgi:hypothetical protein
MYHRPKESNLHRQCHENLNLCTGVFVRYFFHFKLKLMRWYPILYSSLLVLYNMIQCIKACTFRTDRISYVWRFLLIVWESFLMIFFTFIVPVGFFQATTFRRLFPSSDGVIRWGILLLSVPWPSGLLTPSDVKRRPFVIAPQWLWYSARLWVSWLNICAVTFHSMYQEWEP